MSETLMSEALIKMREDNQKIVQTFFDDQNKLNDELNASAFKILGDLLEGKPIGPEEIKTYQAKTAAESQRFDQELAVAEAQMEENQRICSEKIKEEGDKMMSEIQKKREAADAKIQRFKEEYQKAKEMGFKGVSISEFKERVNNDS